MTIIWQFVDVFPRTIKSHDFFFDGPCRPSIYEYVRLSVQCQYRNTIQIKLKVKFRPELDDWWLVEGQNDENIE